MRRERKVSHSTQTVRSHSIPSRSPRGPLNSVTQPARTPSIPSRSPRTTTSQVRYTVHGTRYTRTSSHIPQCWKINLFSKPVSQVIHDRHRPCPPDGLRCWGRGSGGGGVPPGPGEGGPEWGVWRKTSRGKRGCPPHPPLQRIVGVKGGASSPMNGILFEVVELSSPLSQIHRPSPACGGRLEWDDTLSVCVCVPQEIAWFLTVSAKTFKSSVHV